MRRAAAPSPPVTLFLVDSSDSRFTLGLSLGRVHTQYPFVRPTAAKGWQYVADNIMHQQSHQGPQRRTVTIIQTPASREGRRGRARDECGDQKGKKNKIKKKIRKELGIYDENVKPSVFQAQPRTDSLLFSWGRLNPKVQLMPPSPSLLQQQPSAHKGSI